LSKREATKADERILSHACSFPPLASLATSKWASQKEESAYCCEFEWFNRTDKHSKKTKKVLAIQKAPMQVFKATADIFQEAMSEVFVGLDFVRTCLDNMSFFNVV
jgi:hypothetical protein